MRNHNLEQDFNITRLLVFEHEFQLYLFPHFIKKVINYLILKPNYLIINESYYNLLSLGSYVASLKLTILIFIYFDALLDIL
jgi:hypothetical protein